MLSNLFLIKLYIFFTYFFKLNALTCYSCQFSYNELYNQINLEDSYCTNKTLLEMPNDEVIKRCSSVDNYCSVCKNYILFII